jgi:ribonucleoside-diphosphate reductase alpha chain
MLHFTAWQKGVKSLYYCRSKSVQRAAFAGKLEEKKNEMQVEQPTDYEECLACQ